MISSCSSFIVYVGGFPEQTAAISKTSCVNCDLQPFLKGQSYLQIRTLSPSSYLGFLYSHNGLLCRMDRKSEFLTFFGIKSIEHFFSGLQVCGELRQIVNVLVSKIFHVTVKRYFSRIVLFVQRMEP